MQMKNRIIARRRGESDSERRKTLAERTAEAAHLTEREVDVLRLMATVILQSHGRNPGYHTGYRKKTRTERY